MIRHLRRRLQAPLFIKKRIYSHEMTLGVQLLKTHNGCLSVTQSIGQLSTVLQKSFNFEL